MSAVTRVNQPADLLRLLRPHQWTKSGFVLVGLLFSPSVWTDPAVVTHVLLCAAAFALVASGVYVINDLADAEKDRAHPTKCTRPLASGAVTSSAALILLVTCWGAGFTVALHVSVMAAALLAAYAALNLGYSFGWKNEMILDVFLLASGFVLRVLVGTLAVGIEPSQWLLLTSTTVALFLGFAKRRAEYARMEAGTAGTRKVLEQYSKVVLDKAITISAACTILAYSLYTVAPDTVARHDTGSLVYTVPLVMYGVFRYLACLHAEDATGDPSEDLLRDRHIQITVALWLVVTAWVLA